MNQHTKDEIADFLVSAWLYDHSPGPILFINVAVVTALQNVWLVTWADKDHFVKSAVVCLNEDEDLIVSDLA